MRFNIEAALLSLCMVATAAAGDYGTMTVTFDGRGPHEGNGGRFDWKNVAWNDQPGHSVLPYDLNLDGGILYTFCIETQEYIKTSGPTTYDVNMLIHAPDEGQGPGKTMDSTRAAHLETIADNYFSLAVSATDNPWGTKEQEAAAFQLAAWEVVFGDYFTAGKNAAGDYIGIVNGLWKSGSYSSAAENLAKTWLTKLLDGDLSDNLNRKTLALVSAPVYDANGNLLQEGHQDQIMQIVNPEASSIVLWSVMGIGLVWWYGRRRDV